MEVKSLKITDKDILCPYLDETKLGWENDFSTLFCWDVNGTMKVILEDGIVIFTNVYYGKVIFMPPLVSSPSKMERAFEIISEYAEQNEIKEYRIRGLNDEQAKIADKLGYHIEDNRGDYDYLYLAKNLKTLQGKDYHSKRNFVTRFEKSGNYTVKKYEDSEFESTVALVNKWNDENSEKASGNEYKAILKALRYYKELELKILLIKDGEKVIALSLTSKANNGVYHTLFEKADTSYTGIYQAVNKYSAIEFFDDDAIVNRQEDLGVEGLRKAKLSYCPTMLLKKIIAIKK